MRYPQKALKTSNIFPETWKTTYICRAVFMPRKDLRKHETLLTDLSKRDAKGKAKLQIAGTKQSLSGNVKDMLVQGIKKKTAIKSLAKC